MNKLNNYMKLNKVKQNKIILKDQIKYKMIIIKLLKN